MLQLCSVSNSPLTHNPFATISNKVWEVYFSIELCPFVIIVLTMFLHVYEYITRIQPQIACSTPFYNIKSMWLKVNILSTKLKQKIQNFVFMTVLLLVTLATFFLSPELFFVFSLMLRRFRFFLWYSVSPRYFPLLGEQTEIDITVIFMFHFTFQLSGKI